MLTSHLIILSIHFSSSLRAFAILNTSLGYPVALHLIRELNIKNRWSTYKRGIAAIVLIEGGAGITYGFEKFTFIYAFTLIYGLIHTFLFRHRLVKA